ncbi:MAG: hypothetical protein AAFQ47_14105, partial [Pseudomonadota bacterium]
MTKRVQTHQLIHVTDGEVILPKQSIGAGLKAAITRDIGKPLATLTVGSGQTLVNPVSGLDAFCGGGGRSSSSSGSSSSRSSSSSSTMSRASASRYT